MSTPRSSSRTLATGQDGLAARWAGATEVVGGIPFVATSAEDAALAVVAAAVEPGRVTGEHVHLANANNIALASRDDALAALHRRPHAWNLPDGKSVTTVSRLRRHRPRLQQVRGPQLMLDVVDQGRAAGLRHYLLGGTPETLARLRENLELEYPGVRIVGEFSPPFRTPTEAEYAERDAAIAASGAQVVWVGLGAPKQDFEAGRIAARLPVIALAVGAAFDYGAGTLKAAPHLISAVGLEWFWRLCAEPRRLWRRYTLNSGRFLIVVAFERAGRPGRAIRG